MNKDIIEIERFKKHWEGYSMSKNPPDFNYDIRFVDLVYYLDIYWQ